MNKINKHLVIGASVALLIVIGVVAGGADVLANNSSTSTVGLPPAPLVNVYAVGPDFIELDWGPGQPGEFYPSGITNRSMIVNWGASTDSIHSTGLTYTLSKNDKVIATGLTRTYNKVGFTTKERSFRTCVTAINSTGKSSSPMCATWTAP